MAKKLHRPPEILAHDWCATALGLMSLMTWFATVASPRLVDKSRATQNVLPGATVLRCQGQVGMMIQREYTQICGINVGS